MKVCVLNRKNQKRQVWTVASLTVCAVHSKNMTFTLPVVVLRRATECLSTQIYCPIKHRHRRRVAIPVKSVPESGFPIGPTASTAQLVTALVLLPVRQPRMAASAARGVRESQQHYVPLVRSAHWY